jgi:hypothetical protein
MPTVEQGVSRPGTPALPATQPLFVGGGLCKGKNFSVTKS